jgi:hypothetical protein
MFVIAAVMLALCAPPQFPWVDPTPPAGIFPTPRQYPDAGVCPKGCGVAQTCTQ